MEYGKEHETYHVAAPSEQPNNACHSAIHARSASPPAVARAYYTIPANPAIAGTTLGLGKVALESFTAPSLVSLPSNPKTVKADNYYILPYRPQSEFDPI